MNPAYLYVDPDQRIRTPAPSPVPGRRFRFYRGLGSVVVLGLSLSAVLTMIIIPPLLALFLGCGPKKLVLEDFEPD